MAGEDTERSTETEEMQGLIYARELRQLYETERAQRRELETSYNALQKLDDERVTFIALLVQELRTPVAVVDGYLSLLAKHPERLSVSRQGELLDLVARRAVELSRMVRELGDFAELRTLGGNAAALPRPAVTRSVGQIVRDAARALAEIATRREVRLERKVEADRLRFRDEARLQLIVEHLWSNAVKFGRLGGFARLRVHERDGMLVIEVSDNGAGIAPEQRDAIFDAFRHVEAAPEQNRGGLGLGLAIVRMAVRDLGGQLSLQTSPDTGTTVEVQLPIAGGVTKLSEEESDLERAQDATTAGPPVTTEQVQRLQLEQREFQAAIARRDEQLLRFAQDFRTAYEQERTARAALHRAYIQTVHALARAVEARDYVTGDHIGRVAATSLALGRELKMPREDLEPLEMAGMLHDVGKIQVPDSVLLKPGSLDEGEWTIMRAHTTFGGELTGQIEFLEKVSRIVRSHHERLDGSGYPDGLVGDAIPLEARIVTVADVFDAMTNDRPYREALPASAALEELRRNRGTAFDPEVVAAFECLWDRGAIRAPSGPLPP